MAIVKQRSDTKRQWFDWLPLLACGCALLTLISALVAGFVGQRLDGLAQSQMVAYQAEKDHKAQNLSATLEATKAEWEKKQVSLEKALLSAKLKLKAEQTTSANIRKRLVTIQKQLETLKQGDTIAASTSVESAPASTLTAPAQASTPQATSGQKESPTPPQPETPSTQTASEAVPTPQTTAAPEGDTETLTPAPSAGTTATSPSSDASAGSATPPTAAASTGVQASAMPTPQVSATQQPLLAVPDAEAADTE